LTYNISKDIQWYFFDKYKRSVVSSRATNHNHNS
jgi:hypothetical protein